ncbi:protease complex subunit PrcB family protein [uncultured Eubacterium sp.]|uniref:protease complex subunit PrcB family protein n=1 Tax=uncultured Eubacterium sp. TaxID=165185 RepID=UPI0025EF22E3|nr:protease complex subunit PrcB family protein [uncultured Eubacterium sp.]
MKKTGVWTRMCRGGAVVCLIMILGCVGCGVQKTGTEKIRDVDYTVVTEQEMPPELQTEIENRKAEDFKMTYMLDDALYIVRGFGMQETGGYSIEVRNLYLAENALYFETDLIGPDNGVQAEKTVSYPYIAVKTERLEENVVFE